MTPSIHGAIPDWLLAAVALPTIFVVMFHVGMAAAPGEHRAAWRARSLMAKALFASVLAVPVVAFAAARAFGVPRNAEIGIMLMAIAPGAPVALRRALGAGANHSFALALQVAVATLAVASMPVFVAILDEVYAGSASVAPRQIAEQVLVAQLLPLALGIGARRRFGAAATRAEPVLAKLAASLLALFVGLIVLDVWHIVSAVGGRVFLAIAAACVTALCAGHLLGGPAPATRTALAVSCAARNAGLALVVAALNSAPAETMAALLAYLVVSALTVTPYLAWRRRSTLAGAPGREMPPQKTNLP